MEQSAELKQRARATWGAGDYGGVAMNTIWSVGPAIVERVAPREGEDVLDIACGTGNATIPAAAAGARVVGLDLTPKLLEEGRGLAAEAGVEVDWVEGDAEALPFEDESFDVVISTFGIMFAPDHRRAASELARVLRPGGRICLANWEPEGGIGLFFRTIASHMPPPPGFQPPPLWGSEEHVRELFEGTGVTPEFDHTEVVMRFDSVEEILETFESRFGPVMMAKAALEPEGKWQALRDDLEQLWGSKVEPDGSVSYVGEYLVVTGGKG